MAWSRRWRIGSREKWRAVLGALLQFEIDFERIPVELIAREEPIEKSPGQRALFHAVCDDVGTALGYFPGEFKAAVKRVYFGDEDTIDRLLVVLRGIGDGRYSTEDLDHEHYGALIECAYSIAAWAEIVIPDRRRR